MTILQFYFILIFFFYSLTSKYIKFVIFYSIESEGRGISSMWVEIESRRWKERMSNFNLISRISL